MALLIDFLRYILWLVARLGFWIMDGIYSVIIDVAAINIWDIKIGSSPSSVVEEYWGFFVGFIGIAVAIRLVWFFTGYLFNFIKQNGTEELVKKLFMIIIVMLVINTFPFFAKGISTINTDFLEIFKNNNTKPSTLMLTASAKNETGYWTEDGEYVTDNDYEVITVDLIESQTDGINNAQWYDGVVSIITGDKTYTYFDDILVLVILAILSIYCSFLFIFISLDIGKRMWELIMLIIYGFIPISSLINDGKQFSEWLKMIGSIYISNFTQVFMVLIVMLISSNISSWSFFVWIVLIVSGLFFTMNGSNKIAQLLGIDTSTSTMQDLANLSLTGRSVIGLGSSFSHSLANNMASITRAGGYALGGVGSEGYGNIQSTTSYSEPYSSANRNPKLENMVAGTANSFRGENYINSFANALENVNGTDTDNAVGVSEISELQNNQQTDPESSTTIETGGIQEQVSASVNDGRIEDNISQGYDQAIKEMNTGNFINEKPDALQHTAPANGTISPQPKSDFYSNDAKNSTNNYKQQPMVTHTYSENKLWRSGSAGERFQKWAYGQNGVKGFAAKGISRTLDNSYEKALRRKQQRRYQIR